MIRTRPPATFHGWLVRQRRRQDAVGRLAREARRDSSWPRRGRRLWTFDHHLVEVGAVEAVREALLGAWAEFERDRAT